MSRSIDERIVEMKFNNKDFERNAAETMSTLEKLKAKLKFDGATKGIEEIERAGKKFQLSGMENAANVVVKKFDWMASAANAAVRHIVDNAMSAGEKLVKSLSVDQIAAGWEKYSKMTTSVGTMIAQGFTQEDVSKELERLLWFTDETSYDFAAMSDSIGKFTASGKGLKESVDAIEGIALWAAKSGQNASTASRAMYQLSQAIGRSVSAQDWISVSNANMDTAEFRKAAMEAAVEVGTLQRVSEGVYKVVTTGAEATINNFKDSLSEKWFTSDVQMEVYRKYTKAVDDIYNYTQEHNVLAAEAIRALKGETDEFSRSAFAAGQETRTLADAIDATKDAVSSGWMKTFEFFIGDYTQATAFWSDFVEKLYDVFAEPLNSRNEMLAKALPSGFRQFASESQISTEILAESISQLIPDINDARKAAAESAAAAMAEAMHLSQDDPMLESMRKSYAGIDLDALIEKYGSLEDSLQAGWLTADMFAQAIADSVKYFDDLRAENPGVKFADDVKAEEEAFRALHAQIQNNEIDLQEVIDLMSKPSGRYNLVTAFSDAWQSLIGEDGVISVFKSAISEVFPPITAEQLYNFTTKVKEFAGRLKLSKDQAAGLRNMLKLLLQPFKHLWTLIKTVGGWLGKLFGRVNDGIRGFLERFKDIDSFDALLEKIFGTDRFQRLSNAWDTITKKVTDAWDKVKKAFGKVGDNGEKANVFLRVWTKIKDVLTPIADKLLDYIVIALELIANLNWDKIAQNVIDSFNAIKEWFAGLPAAFAEVWESIKTFFGSLGDDGFVKSIKEFWETVKEIFNRPGQYMEWVGEDSPFAQIAQTVGSAFDGSGRYLEKFWAILKGVISELTPGKIALIAFGAVALKLLLSINTLVGASAGVADSISSFFYSLSKRVKPSPITKIALAIVALAGALTMLSMVAPENLKQATTSLMQIAVVFAGLMVVGGIVEKTLTKGLTIASSAFILSMAASMVILAAALQVLSAVDTSKMSKQFEALATIVLMWLAASVVIGAASGVFKSGMFGVLAVAGSLYILVLALKQLEKVDINTIKNSVPQLTAIFGVLSTIAVLMRVMGMKRFGSAMGVTGMVLNLLFTAKVLEKLADEPFDRILKGLLAFVPIFIALELLAVIMRTSSGTNEFWNSDGKKYSKKTQNAGLSMLAMAGGLYVIALALKQIGDIPWEQLAKGVATTVVLFGVFGLVIRFALYADKETTKAKSSILKAGVAVLLLSAAMLVLSAAIAEIGKIPTKELVSGTAAISVLLLSLGFMMKWASKAKEALGVLALMAIVLLEIAGLLVLMSLWPDSRGLIVAMASVATILLSMGAMIKLMSSSFTEIDALTGSKKTNWAAMLASVGIALGAVFAIGLIINEYQELIQHTDWKRMIAFTGGIALLVVAIAGALRIMSGIKLQDRGENLRTVLESAAVTFGALALFAIALGGLSKVIPDLDQAMETGITLMASMWRLWPFLLTMAVLTTTFVGVAALYKTLNVNQNDFVAVILAFTAISLIITGITAVIAGFDMLVPDAIEKGIAILASMWQLAPVLLEFAALTTILVAVAAMYNALRVDAMSFASVAVGFAALMLLIVGLAWLVEQFTQNDGSNVIVRGILTLSYMSKLGPALLEMSGVMAVITFLGMLLAGPQLGLALVAVLGLEVLFGVLIGIIGLVALFLGAITQGGGLEKVLRGLEMMVKIATATGDAIGGFVGGILGGMVGGLASALPTAANMFNWFIDIMAPAVEKMNNLHIDQGAVDSMRNLVETMLLFSAAGFVESIPIIGEVLGQASLAHAAEQLSAMIDAMITVDQKLSEYNKSTTDHAVFDKDLTERLRGFASMFKEIRAVVPRTGGWAQKILGEQDMETFGNRIVKFVLQAKLADITLRRYIDSVGDAAWNKDTTERVINIGTMFANLEKAIPAQGGVLQDFLGSSSLDTFGARIVTFIDAMVSFDTAIRLYEEEHGGFKKSRAASVVTIGTMLANLEKALPEQKGAFLAFFSTNKQSLADFASGLGPLGEGIASFAVALNDSEGGDILGDAQKMKDAAEALKVIVEAWSGLAGETNGTTVDKIANGEISVLDSAAVLGSLLQDWITPAENGETKINAVKHMAEGLVQFAQAIAPFFDVTAGMDFTRLTAFGQAFADIAMAFDLAGSMDDTAVNRLKLGALELAQLQVNSFIEELYAQKKRVNDTSKEVFVDTLADMINAPDVIEKQQSIGYTLAENVQTGAKMRFDKPTALTQADVENMFAGGAGPEQSYQMARQYGENLADATSAGYSENVELAAPASAIPGMDLTSMFQYIPGMGGSGGFEIGNIIGNDALDGLKGILSGSVGDTGGITSMLSGVFNPSNNADLLEGLTGDGGDIADALTGGTLSFLGDSANYEDIYSVLGDSFGSFGTGTDLTELGNLMNADGSEAMLAYFGGMPEAIGSEEAQKSLSGTFDELTKAMKGNIDEAMPNTGKYAVDGFIKGINHPDSLKKLRTAGESMGTTLDKALRGRLRIDSPSKVFEESGQYTVVGFVKGVLESMYMAKDAADKLGISTVDAMSAAVSYAYAAAISDYDFTPTISPVLDLSEVRAGASGLSGLFDLSPQIKMASDNNRMVNEYVSRVQADSAAAFAALNNLKDNMAKVGGRLEDGWQPDLEGAIERGFSNVSVNLDGKKVGKMNVDYQNRQNFLRNTQQVK